MGIFSNMDIKPITRVELMNRGFINTIGNIFERNIYSLNRIHKLRMRYQAQTHEFSWWIEMLGFSTYSYIDCGDAYVDNNWYTKVDNIVTVQDLDTVLTTALSKTIQSMIDCHILPKEADYNYFCK